MRLLAMLMLAAMMARSGRAEMREVMPTVTVCMDYVTDIRVTSIAQLTASRLFAQIGVKLLWYPARHCPANGAILVSVSTHTPPTQMPGAMAYSLPYEGTHIVVF